MLTLGAGALAVGRRRDQFNISLDYHRRAARRRARHPGPHATDPDTVAALRAEGIDGIRFNTVIKNDNLDQLIPIVAPCGGIRRAA